MKKSKVPDFSKEIRKVISVKKNNLGIKEEIKNMHVKFLGIGENNQSVLAVVNKKYKFVFRITLRKVKDITRERRRFNALSYIPEGIGPKAILFDESKKYMPDVYMILSYVEGKPQKKWTKKNIELHAKALAKLHSQKFPFWTDNGKRKKKLSLYKKFLETVSENKIILKDKEVRKLLPVADKYVKENDYLFANLNEFSIIHGDCCNDNILFHKGSIRYIDWEWMSIADSAEDLARTGKIGFSFPPWNVYMTKSQENYLFDVYLKYRSDETLRQRVEVWKNMMLFTDLLYFKRKIKNFDKSVSALQKSHYQKASKVMAKLFKTSFS